MSKKTPEYWAERLADTAKTVADRSAEEIMKRQRKAYQQTLKELEQETTALYERIRRDGEVTPLSLYKKDRLEAMKKQANGELRQLGKLQERVCRDGFSQTVIEGYQATGKLLGVSFDRISPDFVEQIVHSKWSGEYFSDRIWDNLNTLARNIEKAVVNSVAAGRSKDEAVREIMKVTGNSFYNADRLVRTEVMHCINQAQAEIYRKAGAAQYQIIVAQDERTCSICGAFADAVFPLDAMAEGVNCPVFHPMCRCTIAPVL